MRIFQKYELKNLLLLHFNHQDKTELEELKVILKEQHEEDQGEDDHHSFEEEGFMAFMEKDQDTMDGLIKKWILPKENDLLIYYIFSIQLNMLCLLLFLRR